MAGISVIVFSGCSMVGGTSMDAPVSSSGIAASSVSISRGGVRYVYTCQSGSKFQCLVYDPHGNPVRTITQGISSPIGVAADPAGNVYVANEFAHDVTEYGPGGQPLLATLDDLHDVPLDVAVRDGVVVVANLHNARVFGRGGGSRVLHIPNVLQASGVAFDSRGNCYVSFVRDSFGSAIDSYGNCRGKAQEHDLATGTPYGMAFDGADNLYFTDVGPDTQGVYACTGLSSCRLVYPQFIGAFYINFSANFAHLFVASQGGSNGPSVSEVDVKSGKIVRTFTAGLDPSNPPLGVAAGPGPPYARRRN